MKFLSLATALSSLIATVSASIPSTYTLVADGGWTVVTDGTHLYIGTGDIEHYPILILKGGANNTMITGHKQYDTSTPLQHLYVKEDETAPIALTKPDGAAPAGASVTGFGVDGDNYLLLDGEEAWGVEPSEGQIRKIYWLGGDDGDEGEGEYEGIGLWVKECRGC
ncbi:hypothetical protein AnigIFM63604_010474 [Aspergillus niger]|uniref:Uncharacterized protein n=2 Tax=Aspergillus TaxID=5052 RepID=A0A370PDE2_ASPPH|nr:hypothetical protein M752DRAFT_337410 [Aspergillus phoenicis ATCC 13157]GLA53383.1 hypothetical protein AnigIFM63604_010474 [Aspergillus niger]